jgi:hypothetical protein
MQDQDELADLEQRLAAALVRIGTALDGLARPEPLPEPAPAAADAAGDAGLDDRHPPAAADPAAAAPPDTAVTASAGATEAAAEIAHLRAALDDERIVTAQLEERIRRMKTRGFDGEGMLRGERDDARAALAQMDADLQSLRQANDDLRAASAALRTAAAAGAVDAALINSALETELAALTATRRADAAEAEAILTAIAPLLAAPVEAEEV